VNKEAKWKEKERRIEIRKEDKENSFWMNEWSIDGREHAQIGKEENGDRILKKKTRETVGGGGGGGGGHHKINEMNMLASDSEGPDSVTG
jgi:hypothetical protein